MFIKTANEFTHKYPEKIKAPKKLAFFSYFVIFQIELYLLF